MISFDIYVSLNKLQKHETIDSCLSFVSLIPDASDQLKKHDMENAKSALSQKILTPVIK